VSPDLIIFISGFLEIILNRPWSNHCGVRWSLEVSLLLDGEQYVSTVAAGGEPKDWAIPFQFTPFIFSNCKKKDNEIIIAEIYSFFYQ